MKPGDKIVLEGPDGRQRTFTLTERVDPVPDWLLKFPAGTRSKCRRCGEWVLVGLVRSPAIDLMLELEPRPSGRGRYSFGGTPMRVHMNCRPEDAPPAETKGDS